MKGSSREDNIEVTCRAVNAANRNLEGLHTHAGQRIWSIFVLSGPDPVVKQAFGPYGVVTVDRRPKLAFQSLVKMYGGSRVTPAGK